MGSSQILTRGEAAVKYTRFEKARIIGARALQISMGAPTLLELEKGVVDPIRIAEAEFEAGVIPITVRRELGPPA
jgi:DNA-directed RNA polymerase subunit K